MIHNKCFNLIMIYYKTNKWLIIETNQNKLKNQKSLKLTFMLNNKFNKKNKKILILMILELKITVKIIMKVNLKLSINKKEDKKNNYKKCNFNKKVSL